MISSVARLEARNRRLRMLLVLPAAAVVAACSSSGTSSSGGSSAHVAASAVGLKTAKAGSVTVLTNAKASPSTRSPPIRPPRRSATGRARRTGRR